MKQLKDKIVNLENIEQSLESLTALNLLLFIDKDFEMMIQKIMTNDYEDLSDQNWNWVVLVLSMIDSHLEMTKYGKMLKAHVVYAFEHIEEPEDFKLVKYNGNVLEVGTKGTIKMCGVKLSQRVLGNGYVLVNIPGSRSFDYVHKIVCKAFFGKRQKDEVVDHKNGVKFCNFVENLHYVSKRENYDNRQFAPDCKMKKSHFGEMIICESKTDDRRFAFNSVREASRQLDIPAYAIYRVLDPDDWPKSAHGFKFSTMKKDTFNKNFK